MNELMIFKNEEFGQIRTVEIDGKPYFVGKDIANSLGYSNPRDAISRHCKGVVKHDSFKEGGQNISLIPEGDMYRLITHSKLESAERFESWVFDEVLPTLRKTGSYEMPKKKPTHKEKLPSVNQMVKNIKGALNDAGVDSKYIAAEIIRIYSDNGYPVKVPLISEVPVLWDCTTMAKEFGILSESGRPHDKAVSAIIQKLDVSEAEIVKTAYCRNGHDGVTVQYKDSVFQKVKEWLEENGYPTLIEHRLSNGNTNKCKVVYQEVA
jgi:prophage antirepressor-like protein